MSDFLEVYRLTRGRFEASLEGLSQAQLNFRINEGSLTIAESALHVAGTETRFASFLLGKELNETDQRLADSALNGIMNEEPFPFTPDELTPEVVQANVARGREWAERLIASDSTETREKTTVIRNRELRSILGPMINGEGALVRMSAHPFYHLGQFEVIKRDPNFPSS
ncbi:MAG: DUF664 domain-containing protein [Armatimonadetes bacterium]|nr:DUF664 domain-containing protein [Armatimonadota bacterium]